MIAEPRIPVLHKMIDLISNGLLLDDAVSDKDAYQQANGYEPHGSAKELHEDNTSSEVLISGPAGTGKSRACLEKLHECALKYKNMRALIVRKTRASLSETALKTFEQDVLGRDHPMLQHQLQRQNRQRYNYPNGSEIIPGGMDKASRIMSSDFDLIFVQEATELSVDDWEALLTRLRNGKMPFQQLIADCNPDAPEHFLMKRYHADQLRLIPSVHEDNPTLYDLSAGKWTEHGEKYIAKLDALTGVRYDRLRLGLWKQAEGAVYSEFKADVHIIPSFDIPSDWRRIRVIDFGYTNPFVCQWWAVDPDGRMYLYREIYWSQRIVEDHARQILALSEGEHIEATVADHDAEDRATLERHGILTIQAIKDVTPGIQAVQARLRNAGDGKPRLFVFNNALIEIDERLADLKRPISTREEFPGYVWPKGVDGKAVKEIPVKEHDHGMDAARYGVAYLDFRPTWEAFAA